MSTNENDRGARDAGTSRPRSPERERQRRRIWRTTRALALGGVAATAAFVFAAAHGGTRSAATSNAVQPSSTGTAGLTPRTSEDGYSNGYGEDGGGESSDDDGGSYAAPSLAPSQSSPTPSYSPPVTNTGGS